MISEAINRYTLVPTADGSYTIYDKLFGAHFHSLHGALTESRYVYIYHGLEYYIKKFGTKNPIRILEFGFGSGMNAFLTAQYAEKCSFHIHYLSLEKYLLPDHVALDYIYRHKNLVNVDVWLEIWKSTKFGNFLNRNFSLKITDTWNDDWKEIADIIFWDAFGPAQHAEMWTLLWLDKIKKSASRPCALSTFCAQGQFKRNLKTLGFEVISPPGPKGKKEITVALLH